MTKVVCPSVFIIDGRKFVDLQFRVFSHFKKSDIILGFLALKQLGDVIHPSVNTFSMGNFTINYNRESRRISCMIVDFDKSDQIIVEQARNKENPSDVFLISLHFAEYLGQYSSLAAIGTGSITIQDSSRERFDRTMRKAVKTWNRLDRLNRNISLMRSLPYRTRSRTWCSSTNQPQNRVLFLISESLA